MAKNPKWGESFLKTGLPLEHLTGTTFRDAGWSVHSEPEFERVNAKGQPAWFSVDMVATSPQNNGDTELGLFVECKYHAEDRFWIFVPGQGEPHRFADHLICHCFPFQTLEMDFERTNMLGVAPLLGRGTVVSEFGLKQDDAVFAAVQQVVNGYVPYGVTTMFGYNAEVIEGAIPWCTALIPLIVTNARIFRLRPTVTDLRQIRQATAPGDVADELQYGWLEFDSSLSLYRRNYDAINDYVSTDQFCSLQKRFPGLGTDLPRLAAGPRAILVAQIGSLPELINKLWSTFSQLKTARVKTILRRIERKRQSAGTAKGRATGTPRD